MRLSIFQKKAIKLIGDANIYFSTGLELSSLEQASRAFSNSYPGLSRTLSYFLTADLIREHTDEQNRKFYYLTAEGRQLYNVLEEPVGLAMPREEIALETLQQNDLRRDIFFVEAFVENWMGEFVHWLGDPLYEQNALENSLFFCYVSSQTVVFNWLSHSLLSGAYVVVLRELRSILEGLFSVYFIDTKNSTQSLEEKLQTLNSLEQQGKSHGKAVFEKSGFSNWKPYYQLYKELCGYVHVSKKVSGQQILLVAKQGFPELLEPEFDKASFLKCVHAWRSVAVLATELTSSLLINIGANDFAVHHNIFEESDP